MNNEIEEMAKALEIAGKTTSFRNGKIDLTLFKTSEEIAETLYYLNYRKIPEDAVVLTREEYQMLNYFNHRGEELLKQERKEMAKEIFARFRNKTHQGVDLGGFFVEITLRMEDLVWIENRYGVEVE